MHEVAGREAELAAIRTLLDAAAAGRGGALALAAGPGEGRTTLLHAAATLAGPGWTVLAAAGHVEEAGWDHGGLQRLIEPLGPLVAELPAHQREPLTDVIAGRAPAAGPLLLGVSVLALLRLATRARPVLCLVDDADLLDAPSGQQVRLVARRLGGLPVALLAGVRASAEAYAGLPTRRLPPLSEEAAHRLVRDLAPDVATALVELAAGHPGALADLAASLTPEQRRGFAPPPTTLTPDSGLRRQGRTALAALPAATRHLLLLAAADLAATGHADVADLLAAAGLAATGLPDADVAHLPAPGRAGPTLADLAPAERAGLVEVSAGGLRFTPAVMRLVVLGEAPIAQRHDAHHALARAYAARGRRLRALLHRAAVAPGADDLLAHELLDAAEGAPARLAFAAQRHAAELGSNPSRALLAAARSALAAGRPREARPLLRRASEGPGNAVVRARARALVAEMHVRGAPAEARDTLLDVAAELLPVDPGGALDALLVAGEACGRAGEPGRYPVLARQAVARCAGGRPATEMAVHQVAGVADLFTGDDEAAFGRLREVLRLAGQTTDPVALLRAANTGILLGRDRRAARLARQAVTFARAAGNARLVPEALETLAYAELAAGRHDAAVEAALDGAAVARGAGRPELAEAHLSLLGLLAAFTGDAATSRQRAGDNALGQWAEALLDLVAGHPEQAAGRLARVARTGSMTLRVAIAPHLVEATGGGGEVFDRWAGRTGQPGWLALRSRCRALTDASGADDYFREALGWHERDEDAGFALAHTELLYGRHLRRRRRPAEAREHLRRAAETFHRFDAGPWAEQAARELRAAGERIGPVGRVPLTAQQERIAGLVAEGATNREVAQQLHLSPRTIDHHLRNVFARLGVRSRTELARLDLFDGDRRDQPAVAVGHHAQ
ncbi:LuxR C-terminal-related transcriptional regulator [Actinoplanes sp. URMC 104]|uniref:helix-turn-helix transcriptional regulator n=1 Tax=Actinoplanes sp. URMC 104 TaxID=3423409 RepID=UPI003F1B582A